MQRTIVTLAVALMLGCGTQELLDQRGGRSTRLDSPGSQPAVADAGNPGGGGTGGGTGIEGNPVPAVDAGTAGGEGGGAGGGTGGGSGTSSGCSVTHAQIDDGELRVAMRCYSTSTFQGSGDATYSGITKNWPTWTAAGAGEWYVAARHDTSVRANGVVTLELDDVGNFTAPASGNFVYNLKGIGSGSVALAFDAAGLPTTAGVSPYPDDGI